MKCAFYESDITPPLYLNMPGYFSERPAQTVKDKIYAKAVLFRGLCSEGSGADSMSSVSSSGQSEERTIAMVSIDANFITEDMVTRIKERICEHTDINEQDITVSATHLHNAGPTVEWGKFVKKDDIYISYVCDKAADAVIIAENNLKPANLRYGNGYLSTISFNRIYKMKNGTLQTNPGKYNPDIVEPSGGIDPDVTVMYCEDKSGKPLGCITNFACHQDCVDEYVYSGDYSSRLSDRLKEKFGHEFVSHFVLGTCGNINHFDVKTDKDTVPEYYRVMGDALADEVFKTIDKSEPVADSGLSVRSAVLILKKREVENDVETEIAELEKTVKFNSGEVIGSQSDPDKLKLVFDYDLRNYLKDKNPVKNVPVKFFRVGDAAFYSLPGEVFMEYGREIKDKSPYYKNFIITNSNGLFGYIPLRDYFMPTVYESRLGSTSYLEPEAGEKITDAALAMAEDAFAQDGSCRN